MYTGSDVSSSEQMTYGSATPKELYHNPFDFKMHSRCTEKGMILSEAYLAPKYEYIVTRSDEGERKKDISIRTRLGQK